MTSAFAAGLLWLAADTVDPHTLVVTWPDGSEETVAATSAETCAMAALALLGGIWAPVGHPEPPQAVACEHRSSFQAGWDCVKNFNCPR
jgi:hypothetical protein